MLLVSIWTKLWIKRPRMNIHARITGMPPVSTCSISSRRQATWKNMGHSNWFERFALMRFSTFAQGLLPSGARPTPQIAGARAMVRITYNKAVRPRWATMGAISEYRTSDSRMVVVRSDAQSCQIPASGPGSTRTSPVSMTEMCLRSILRKLQRLLSLVANHHGIAAPFSASMPTAFRWSDKTCADREQQHQGEYLFHEKSPVGGQSSLQTSRVTDVPEVKFGTSARTFIPSGVPRTCDMCSGRSFMVQS